MFLGQLDAQQKSFRQRVTEIREVLSEMEMPGPSDPGVTNGVRIPYEIRDRILEIQSRHGLRSSKEALYKSMLLGLLTLERLPAGVTPPSKQNRLPSAARVLSESEVMRIKDMGFRNATR